MDCIALHAAALKFVPFLKKSLKKALSLLRVKRATFIILQPQEPLTEKNFVLIGINNIEDRFVCARIFDTRIARIP